MKTFQAPTHHIDVDCGVQIESSGPIWNVIITFWRPRSFEVSFAIPEKDAISEWRAPLHKGRVYGLFALEEMMRVPRLSAAHLLRKAFELQIIKQLPYGQERLPNTPQIQNRTY